MLWRMYGEIENVKSIQGKLRKTEGGMNYKYSKDKNRNVHSPFIKHDKLVM